ncbi:MAG: ribbon-helix-helix protein, CopG family [Bryobacteraceae bacterium]
MDVTVSLDDELVEKLDRIAASRETTLAATIGETLAQLAEEDLSAQVLAKFSATILRKTTPPATVPECAGDSELLIPVRVVGADRDIVRRALKAREVYRIDFWDGMIAAAAEGAVATVSPLRISSPGNPISASSPATRSGLRSRLRTFPHRRFDNRAVIG